MKPGASALIKDDLLHRLLHAPKQDITTQLTGERPRASTLLDAVDLDNVLAMSADDPDNLRDVPGGTLSFLFQKDSTIITENHDEDGGEAEGDEPASEDGEDENAFASGAESDSSMPATISK